MSALLDALDKVFERQQQQIREQATVIDVQRRRIEYLEREWERAGGPPPRPRVFPIDAGHA